MLPFTAGWINMTFKSYHTAIFLRAVFLALITLGLSWCILKNYWTVASILILLFIFLIYSFFRYFSKRFEVIDDFFEAVKYRDFSRNYLEENKSSDIRRLYNGFNTVNRVVREMNSEKEIQYLYLQKILEMVDIGLLAYNMESGETIWQNEAFQKTLDFPEFKNIKFVKSRAPETYQQLFEKYYTQPATVDLKVHRENQKMLISNSIFKINGESCKLIVAHNIDETVNRTESEAWKKLLSVMTHEIMNSIAPISSLANTLQNEVDQRIKNPGHYLELEDLHAGLNSIGKRSEGLMKFAKTYRSLNKVTSLSKENILIKELFRDIRQLMQSSIETSNVTVNFEVADTKLEVEADSYLLEQVLINLILNALEACENTPNARIKIYGGKKTDERVYIAVADNGPGIPEEIKDQIFVPFFTTKKKGSGIGLSLSKQIMTLHGGKIQIDEPENGGTVVSLIF